MILNKPVKTMLMSAIEAVIKGVSQLYTDLPNQVKHGQGVPMDQDTSRYPWTCFFDEAETKKDRNRITEKTFELVIQTWVRKSPTQTIDDLMDLADALLEKAILNDEDVRYYALKVLSTGSQKFVVDNYETGIVQSTYSIEYAHGWKNPFDLPKP